MNRFFLWLRSLIAWRLVGDTGVWAYWENTITGQRSISRSGPGYQPIDHRWLHRLDPAEKTRPKVPEEYRS